jgi:hypothetical protein
LSAVLTREKAKTDKQRKNKAKIKNTRKFPPFREKKKYFCLIRGERAEMDKRNREI